MVVTRLDIISTTCKRSYSLEHMDIPSNQLFSTDSEVIYNFAILVAIIWCPHLIQTEQNNSCQKLRIHTTSAVE